MSLLIRYLRISYVLVLALLVVILAKPGDSQGQFRGNNMPGAPLLPPAPAVNFGAVGVNVGVFPFAGFNGFGFNGFGLNGFGFGGFPVVGFPAPGIGGFNGFGGFGFNGFGFNGFGMVPGFGFNGFGFNGFGMIPGFGFNGFGFNGFGFAGFPGAFALGMRFPGVAVNVGIAGVPALGIGGVAPLPFAGGFAGKGFGGFNGGNGL
jgi:hypothetical protein